MNGPEAERVRSRVAIGDSRVVLYHDGTPLAPGSRVNVATPADAWMIFPAP